MRRALPFFLLPVLAGTAAAAPVRPGISARFVPSQATIGAPVQITIEVDDPTDTIQNATIELLRSERDRWQRQVATRIPGPGPIARWIGTYTSTTVWAAPGLGVRQPERLLVRARMYGRRGGLILSLGELDPLELDVLTPAEAQAWAQRTQAPSEDPGLRLVGYVGAEARAGSSARARALIGVGGALSPWLELLVYVSVGPRFSPPPTLTEGGPLVLGFEGSLRAFTRAPGQGAFTLFAEPYLLADLRLPGFDPGVGLRVGVEAPLGRALELELALGGAGVLFSASEGRRELGASGGLRIGLRFGGERPAEAR